MTVCSVDGCGQIATRRGWCGKHYARWRANGSPDATKLIRDDPLRRFMEKINKEPSGCWCWTAGISSSGYGKFKHEGRTKLAHRWSYEHFVGPIPEGLTIDHLCRNRTCVNPKHLEPVTSAENTSRSPIAPAAVNARKAKCIRNHALDGDNLKIDHRGKRQCRSCERDRDALYRSHRRGLMAEDGGNRANTYRAAG